MLKDYNTILEFAIGLIGVIIHTIVVVFIVSYLAMPDTLKAVIETTSGKEKELLEQFIIDVEQLDFMVYFGSAIVIFEWVAVFKIFKYTDNRTPLWAFFLILGALYAYFYFGGLEAFVLLFASGLITLIKFFVFKSRKPKI